MKSHAKQPRVSKSKAATAAVSPVVEASTAVTVRNHRARAAKKPKADPRVAEGNGTSTGKADENASDGTAAASGIATATTGLGGSDNEEQARPREPAGPQADPDEESPDDFPADGWSLIRGKQAQALREFFADLLHVDTDSVKLNESIALTNEARKRVRLLKRESDKFDRQQATLRTGKQPKGTGTMKY